MKLQEVALSLLILGAIVLCGCGCSASVPNRMKLIKGDAILDGRIRSGSVRYSSLNLTDFTQFHHIGIELPEGKIIRLSEVTPEWLLDNSTDVEWRGGTEVPRDGFQRDVVYHFFLDRRAYRFGVRNGAIINFGMNPAPLGPGLKDGVLWDVLKGKRYAMPISSEEAYELFGPPDRTERYRFYMN